MILENEGKIEFKEERSLEERIQRFKYSMVYDYRNRKNQESLLMFIMDV